MTTYEEILMTKYKRKLPQSNQKQSIDDTKKLLWNQEGSTNTQRKDHSQRYSAKMNSMSIDWWSQSLVDLQ